MNCPYRVFIFPFPIIDDLVKSPFYLIFVIPAKAGIQFIQVVLDSCFRRSDGFSDFLRDHHNCDYEKPKKAYPCHLQVKGGLWPGWHGRLLFPDAKREKHPLHKGKRKGVRRESGLKNSGILFQR